MNCPHCDGESCVSEYNLITGIRVRRCLECDRKFETVEVYRHKLEAIKFAEHRLDIMLENGGKT